MGMVACKHASRHLHVENWATARHRVTRGFLPERGGKRSRAGNQRKTREKWGKRGAERPPAYRTRVELGCLQRVRIPVTMARTMRKISHKQVDKRSERRENVEREEKVGKASLKRSREKPPSKSYDPISSCLPRCRCCYVASLLLFPLFFFFCSRASHSQQARRTADRRRLRCAAGAA